MQQPGFSFTWFNPPSSAETGKSSLEPDTNDLQNPPPPGGWWRLETPSPAFTICSMKPPVRNQSDISQTGGVFTVCGKRQLLYCQLLRRPASLVKLPDMEQLLVLHHLLERLGQKHRSDCLCPPQLRRSHRCSSGQHLL